MIQIPTLFILQINQLHYSGIWDAHVSDMKKYVILAFLLSILIFPTVLKAKEFPKYEIEGAGVGNQGCYLVKVTLFTNNRNADNTELLTAAVHGVIFKGFSDNYSHITQKPLAGSATNEAKHADFYKDFFSDNGSATSYASVIEGSRSVIKTGKRYKISATLTVRKEDLHKYLEEAGIITGLNSIF